MADNLLANSFSTESLIFLRLTLAGSRSSGQVEGLIVDAMGTLLVMAGSMTLYISLNCLMAAM